MKLSKQFVSHFTSERRQTRQCVYLLILNQLRQDRDAQRFYVPFNRKIKFVGTVDVLDMKAGFVCFLGGNFGRIDYSFKEWRGWPGPTLHLAGVHGYSQEIHEW
jgi:hypothetical protein